MPATSPSSSPALLIAAISGRALAAAARRAGYRTLIADFFCDTDTIALAAGTAILPGTMQHGIDGKRLLETLQQLAGKNSVVAAVLGSGFESKPGLVDQVARHFPLAGNCGDVIRRVKDPQALAVACAELQIPHPAVRRDPPPDPSNWVIKAAGGAGGSHVRKGALGAPGDIYFQRFVPGTSVSALFVGDGSTAHIVGFSRQWTAPAPSAPFRYGGAVRLPRFERRDAEMIGGWLSGLTAAFGLIGLCSGDLIRCRNGYHLIEINPRPGATLDIFDSTEAPLIEAHLRAARGQPFDLPRFADSMASQITYASSAVASFPALQWPDWTADRQSPGTSLLTGDPVCTVFARAANARTARRMAIARASQLQAGWDARQ